MKIVEWFRRIVSDHGDGTNHEWKSDSGFIFECYCGEVDFGEPRID